MKIAIGYPPLESKKGIPFLAQNRQFQWGTQPWNAYPMVPAYAATMLKKAGYEVVWLDGIAEGWTFQKWLSELKKGKADPAQEAELKAVDLLEEMDKRTSTGISEED